MLADLFRHSIINVLICPALKRLTLGEDVIWPWTLAFIIRGDAYEPGSAGRFGYL